MYVLQFLCDSIFVLLKNVYMNDKKNLCLGFYCSTVEKQLNLFAKVDRGIMLMN